MLKFILNASYSKILNGFLYDTTIDKKAEVIVTMKSLSVNFNQIRNQVNCKKGLTLSRKAQAVHEKMFIIFFASLARTVQSIATKIVNIPVTMKRQHGERRIALMKLL